MTWKRANEIAKLVGSKIVAREGNHFLKYDAHGECSVESPQDAMEALQAYRGGHPAFDDAKAEIALG